MEFKNDEEVLDFMTRLLERLHQAGFDQQGSHFQFVEITGDGSLLCKARQARALVIIFLSNNLAV